MTNEPVEDGMPERVPEHIAVYQRIRSVFGNPGMRSGDARKRRRAARDETSVPYGTGRDPRGIGDVLQNLTSEMGWDSPVAQAEVLASWAKIVGPDTAANSEPIGIHDGRMVVRCKSNAWATELRRMTAAIVTKVVTEFPDAGVSSVTFLVPDAPSWKHGPRTVRGVGPRDTYDP